jgi:alpha-D-ribose 1-methylphosphonate 5-triphosphate synthase subunit PhnI
MGYVAVKGGRDAINNAIAFLHYQREKGGSKPIAVRQIQEQLYFAVDKIMSEGSLYAPDLAALAIKQAAGDVLEASFLMRAYRTTQPRVHYSVPTDTSGMRVIRRISSAFKNIPGGQVLGPTPDYTLRLLDFTLMNETETAEMIEDEFAGLSETNPLPKTFPKVVEMLRREGLLVSQTKGQTTGTPDDITREALSFPASRSASLQAMARGETGGLLAIAYSNMRGYGSVHPTIGELRVGYLPLHVDCPVSGKTEFIGEIKVTEAEIISKVQTKNDQDKSAFALGYGLCFGHNETKAISMAVLDRAMQSEEANVPSEDQEFVLTHVDGIEAMGFCNHFKLPHYVTFQSELDRLRKVQDLDES